MDYFERLIRRALATPAAAPEALFDPFAQVAAWVPEVPPPRPADETHDRIVPAAAPPEPSSAPRPPRSSSTPRPAVAAPATQSAGATEPQPITSHPTPPAATPATPLERAAPSNAPATKVAMRGDPLRQADAFMHRLGVATPTSAANAAKAPPTFDRFIDTPPKPARAVQHSADRTAAPERPITARMLRPIPPPAAAVTAREPPPRGALPAAPPATARPRAMVAAGTEQPIVQTTVVVAPPSRPLTELANSIGITRFGLGQL